MEKITFIRNLYIIQSLKTETPLEVKLHLLGESFCKIHFNTIFGTREVIVLALRMGIVVAQFVTDGLENKFPVAKNGKIQQSNPDGW